MSINEIALAENYELNIYSGIAQALAEELDGLGPIPFDKVKIPSGGAMAFEVPGEDEDNPDTLKEITGIIVDHHPLNGYWRDEYSGANQPPDCASYDGKQGTKRDSGDTADCGTCPHNQYGSDVNGKGKACKNMHRLYVLRSGYPMPLLLTLPPTSLRNLRDYLGKRIVLKSLRSWQALTKIGLKKDTSSGGITYSKATFAFGGKLPDDMQPMLERYAQELKASNRYVDITMDDYNADNTRNNKPAFTVIDDDGDSDDSDDMDIPFYDAPDIDATNCGQTTL